MKKYFFLVIFIISQIQIYGAEPKNKTDFFDDFVILSLEHSEVYYHCPNVEIKHKEYKRIVIITDDYQLLINNVDFELSEEQKDIIKEYYQKSNDIAEKSKEIAKEGISLGIEGVKLGASSVMAVMEYILSGMDELAEIEMESKIEEKTNNIEEQAEYLKEISYEIEEMTSDLKILHEDMLELIPELTDFY